MTPESHPTLRIVSVSLAGLALLFSSGCGREGASSYEAPRDKPLGAPAAAPAQPAPAAPAPAMPPAGAQADMASTPVPTAPAGALSWTAPASWRPGRASSMRVGSFSVGPEASAADLAVTTFPGDVGGDLANVNRWRGQIGLGTVSALDESVTALEIAGMPGKLVNLKGPSASTLAAWLRLGEATWFFKLTGDPAVVEAERANFLAFMASVKRAEAAK